MNKGNTRHGMCGTGVYRTWRHMVRRCNIPTDPAYHKYGGRGIKLLWKSFEEFYADMGDKPAPHYSIERRENDGNYEKDNCYWATPKQQARNTRNTKLTERKAQLLRALYMAKAPTCTTVHFAEVVAPLFNIAQATVYNVIYGRQWL